MRLLEIRFARKRCESAFLSFILLIVWMPPVSFLSSAGFGFTGNMATKLLAVVALFLFICMFANTALLRAATFAVLVVLVVNTVRLGVELGTIATAAGFVAYMPLMLAWSSKGVDRQQVGIILRHALVSIVVTSVLGAVFYENGLRFFAPYLMPNTVGAFGASLILLAAVLGKGREPSSYVVVLCLLVIALSMARGAALAATFILAGAAILEMRRRWTILFMLSIGVTVFNFSMRGDFIGQQFGPGGRLTGESMYLAQNFLEHLSSTEIFFGSGFGLATNAIVNFRHFIGLSPTIDSHVASLMGGHDNALEAVFINGGVLLIGICIYGLFGWYIAYLRSLRCALAGACFALAVLSTAAGQHLFEMWPSVVLLFVSLWGAHQAERLAPAVSENLLRLPARQGLRHNFARLSRIGDARTERDAVSESGR